MKPNQKKSGETVFYYSEEKETTMSGNNSRKHKRYMEMKQRRIDYGDIEKRNEYGFSDLVAHSAAMGEMTVKMPCSYFSYKKKSEK